MAFIDPESAFDNIEEGVTRGLHAAFPIVGRDKVLELVSVKIDRSSKDPKDIASQYEAKVGGGSWTVPVHGNVVMKDKQGKELGRATVRLMDVPRMTDRLSFIHKGQEYQVTNQWQLKPGVYARRRQNGELEARFNVTGRAAFDMTFDPETRRFGIEYKKANLPALPILRAMGVKDEELKAAWGEDVFKANDDVKRNAATLAQFHRTSTNGASPANDEDAVKNLLKVMEASKVRPEVTEHTLGKRFEHVTGEALALASKKLIQVHNGAPEDDRDAILFKTLRSTGDLLHDQIKQQALSVATKVQRQLNRPEGVTARGALTPGLFNVAGSKLFESSLANPAKQINPLDMVSSSLSTTIMGPGGIKSDMQVTDEAKMIHPSQFGFVDPLATPEGSSTGVVLRLPLGIRKIGEQPHIALINAKTGQREWVDPITAYNKNIVLADQVTFKDGKHHPIKPEVKMMGPSNRLVTGPMSRADYIMPHASQMFNLTSALVPFVDNDSGNRVSMAVRHMDQSISLKNREAPLVQVQDASGSTLEKTFGHQIAHTAPVDGTVTKITPKGITVEDDRGTSHFVHLYDHYPLNDTKSVLHSTTVVSVGAKVKGGQLLADSNYTKDGHLALGKNMRVAYMPLHGKNFEDSFVITEKAAKALESVHLHKHDLAVNDQMVFGKKQFSVQHPGVFTQKQMAGLGDEGVIAVGAKVQPGDPLVLAMQPYTVKDRVGLGALRKSLTSQHVDKSLRWEGEHVGEVVAVHKTDKGYQVHVKTVEPMQVADKLCYDEKTEVLTRYGWKPVAELSFSDRICCLVDGKIQYSHPTDLHSYAQGGRMYFVETQQLDLLVTANHRMYVQKPSRQHKHEFQLVPADQLYGKRVRYKKDGNWQGDPGATYGEDLLPGLTSEQYLILLGMFLSEGCCVNAPRSGTYGIDIAQVKPEGRALLFAALDSMPFHYTKTPDRVRIHSKSLLEHFAQFGKAKDKFIPEEVFSFPKEKLEILFRWLMWGDGYSKDGRPVVYTTTSKKLADDVQRLCLHIGKAANIHVLPEHVFEQNDRQYVASTRYDVRVVNSKLTPEVNHHHVGKQRAQREGFLEDYDRPVYCVTVPGHVLYVRRNGKPCWSGNSNRHGGKGVVGYIIPDDEAPRDKDGKPVDILFNPLGVGGRMNVGQILETMAGKIAEKTGKTYVVKNFDPTIPDRVEHMKDELKTHGLSDTEELFDPKTGLSYGQILTGPQHFLKLVHQADKKLSVRSGMGLPKLPSSEKYDSLTFQPAGGGGTGGQSYGQLGIYALLAHGATNLLREAMTVKAAGEDPETNEAKRWKTGHVEAWLAMQKGLPLPPPRPTFAFHRFTSLLKAAGINVEKRGSELALSPLTDRQILEMSKGAVPNPVAAVHAKIDPELNHYKPIKGGLFDEKLLGGHGGTHWGHIPLAEPMPNPLFEDPIKKLTGLTGPRFDAVLEGTQRVDPKTGAFVSSGGVTGGAAIKALLARIDVKKELAETKAALKTAPASRADTLYRKARYLGALEQMGLKPDEAYVLHHVPVLPPKLRPLSIMEDGALRYEDMNGLYMNLGQINNVLGDPGLASLPDKEKATYRKELYESMGQLFGSGALPEGAKQKGILHQIAGTSPKCFDGETEILTRRGWVRLDQFDSSSEVATVNLGTDLFEWQKVSEFTVEHYAGPMHRLKGEQLDLLVTPNHAHIAQMCHVSKGVRTWSKWARVPSRTFLRATNRARFMTAAGGWMGQTPVYDFEGRTPDLLAFAAFVGWWLAEGWLAHKRHTYLAQCEPQGIEQIDDVFARLGLPYSRKVYTKKKSTTGFVTYWSVNSDQLFQWLERHVGVGCENKRLSAEILGWPCDMLRALLQGYLAGDGEQAKTRITVGRRTYKRMDNLGLRFSTASRLLIDDLQELACKVGLRVTRPSLIKKAKPHHLQQYRARVLGFRDTSFGEHLRVKEVAWEGTVYGPTVPNGTVVVRRNGTVVVSGNSGLFQKGLLSPRQDATMRAVIIPGPDLHLDQVGLPRDAALEHFRPYVIKNLVELGAAKDLLEAQTLLADYHLGKRKDPVVQQALERAVAERPVILKRDPALHRESIMAFRPVLIGGSSIKLHPLVTGGFNADHDGDSVIGPVLVSEVKGGRGSVRSVDLAHFPHLEETGRPAGKATVYNVPPGTQVFGVQHGSMRLFDVTEYSVHPDLPVWEVKLSDGTVIECSGDHSLAVLDKDTLRIVPCKPEDAEGAAVPLLGLLRDHTRDSLTLEGEDLFASRELGEELGLLWLLSCGVKQALPRLPEKKGELARWRSVLESLLVDSLALPLDFRKGLVSAILEHGLELEWGRLDLTEEEDRQQFGWLSRSVGVSSYLYRGDLFFDPILLQNLEWFQPAWPKYPTAGRRSRDVVFTPEWVREEIRAYNPGNNALWHARSVIEAALQARLQEGQTLSTYAEAWRKLLLEGDLSWARVVSAKKTDRRATMYDLTVDGAVNFLMSSGALVWDTMSVYLPAGEAAVQDALKMLPSRNIFNDATLNPNHVPTMESRLGLHRLSVVGKDNGRSFEDHKQAIEAVAQGKVKLDEQVRINGKTTTPGRILLSEAAPDPLKQELLHNLKLELGGKGLKGLFETVGKNHPKDYVKFVDAFKDLGNQTSTGMISTPLTRHGTLAVGAHSYRLDDFSTDKAARDPLLTKAHAEVRTLQGSNLSDAEKDRRAVDLYLSTFKNINKLHLDRAAQEEDRNRLYTQSRAGVKPSAGQYGQMRLAPGIMKDSKGNLLPTPITHSYGEGLDLAEYWIGSYGARSGSVKKVQEVQEPGYMTKLLQNTSMAQLIDQHDCGTSKGIPLSILHEDVVDRHLAQPLTSGSLHLPAGALLTKDVVDRLRSLDPQAQLVVRSPLHCHSDKGICQKCFGLSASGQHHPVGTNIGVLSAHALGERAVQLTLKAFHEGGAVSGRGGSALGSFQRLEQLTYLPDKTPRSAALSGVEGKVTKIEPTSTGTHVYVEGVPHFVGKDEEGRDLHVDLPGADRAPGYKAWRPPEVGTHVTRGQPLSDPNRTLVNPHRLYEATGDMNRVKHFMAEELHGLYRDEGVRRRAVETVVRAMGNVTKIEDAHDHPELMRGQFYSHTGVEAINEQRKKEGKPLIEHKPSLIGVNLLPLAATEDWMAVLNHQKLRTTLKANAALGAVSHLHGPHPIPGLAFGMEFGKPPPGSKTPY